MNILYTFSYDCMKETLHTTIPPSSIKTKPKERGLLELFGFYHTKIKWQHPLTTEGLTYSHVEYDRKPFVCQQHTIAHVHKSFLYELQIAMNALQECEEDDYIDIGNTTTKIQYIARLSKKRYIRDKIWKSFRLTLKKNMHTHDASHIMQMKIPHVLTGQDRLDNRGLYRVGYNIVT